jgi:hypothetical protein
MDFGLWQARAVLPPISWWVVGHGCSYYELDCCAFNWAVGLVFGPPTNDTRDQIDAARENNTSYVRSHLVFSHDPHLSPCFHYYFLSFYTPLNAMAEDKQAYKRWHTVQNSVANCYSIKMGQQGMTQAIANHTGRSAPVSMATSSSSCCT